MSQPETRTRLLDAAERLFSVEGIESVSLRTITQQAEANLAAVNYHFGSRDGLVREVLLRRIAPVNRERLQRLEELHAGREAPELEDVLDALIRPAMRMASDPQGGAFCAGLMGRLHATANQDLRDYLQELFGEVFLRFTQAIGRCVPHLQEEDMQWRMNFLIGAMGTTMTDCLDLRRRSGGRCDPRDVEAATRQLIQFSAAGLRATPALAGRPEEDEIR